MQAANLSDWQPGAPHAEFEQLLEHITGILGRPELSSAEQESAQSSQAKFEQATETKHREQIANEETGRVAPERAATGEAQHSSSPLPLRSLYNRTNMLRGIGFAVVVVLVVARYRIRGAGLLCQGTFVEFVGSLERALGSKHVIRPYIEA